MRLPLSETRLPKCSLLRGPPLAGEGWGRPTEGLEVGSCAGLALMVLVRCVLREFGEAGMRRRAVTRPNGHGLAPLRIPPRMKHGCDACGVGSHEGC